MPQTLSSADCDRPACWRHARKRCPNVRGCVSTDTVVGMVPVSINPGNDSMASWMQSPRLDRVVITGGAGFIGSHLCERLLAEESNVVCVDNLLTGSLGNIEHLQRHPRFSFVGTDVSRGVAVDGPVDAVLHFASPASPVDYLRFPIQTLKVGALGTHNALGLAKAKRARFLLASTSEVYGDPLVH